MNPPIIILLFFALLGALDKLLNNRFGLAEELDKGLTMMGPLAFSMCGIYCFAIMLGQFLSTRMDAVKSFLPFDPSILISSVLATDMGAYSITAQLCSEPTLVIFSGVMLASTLGTTISFALPVALSSVSKSHTSALMSGIVYGIVTVPLSLLLIGLLVRMPLMMLVRNLLPIIIICALLCFAIFRAKEATTKAFIILGQGIRWLSVLLFILVVFQVFWNSAGSNPIELVRPDLISEVLLVVFKVTVIICGSFILSKLVLKYFMRYIMWFAGKLRINEFAIVGLILSLVTSVSMFSIFDKMDKRGQIMNAAFSVTAAFVFGGQLAFVSAVESECVPMYIFSKLAAGVVAIMLASAATRNELCPVDTE